MKDRALPEFQKYLLSCMRKKTVPFYAYWASKFFYFSNKKGAGIPEIPELRIFDINPLLG